MHRFSYLSPKTEVRESKIHGRGLFATSDIARDEIVAVKGGRIVDRKTLHEKIVPRLGPVEIQIDENLFIAPVTDEERELSMLYSNHSCDANLGMRGEIFVDLGALHRARLEARIRELLGVLAVVLADADDVAPRQRDRRLELDPRRAESRRLPA